MKPHLDLRPIRTLLALLLVMVVAACASSSGGRGQNANGREGVSVLVENTGTLTSDLTVYMISSSGTRQILGSVPPNRNVTLRYDGPRSGGQFRLLARPNGGRDILSNPFGLGGVSTVRWSLQSNVAVPVD
ncbi:MAG TPA: hypothetical protein VF613_05385 [Longimicrobium sp.]|jgi:hypothetical protein